MTNITAKDVRKANIIAIDKLVDTLGTIVIMRLKMIGKATLIPLQTRPREDL